MIVGPAAVLGGGDDGRGQRQGAGVGDGGDGAHGGVGEQLDVVRAVGDGEDPGRVDPVAGAVGEDAVPLRLAAGRGGERRQAGVVDRAVEVDLHHPVEGGEGGLGVGEGHADHAEAEHGRLGDGRAEVVDHRALAGAVVPPGRVAERLDVGRVGVGVVAEEHVPLAGGRRRRPGSGPTATKAS